MNSEQQNIKHRKLFLIISYIAIVFVAIAIWIATTVGSTPSDEAAMMNLDKTDLTLSAKLKSIIQKRLYETVDLAYGIKDGKEPEAFIRKETIQTKTESDGTKVYNFLVDIDNYKLTYKADVYEKRDADASEAKFYCVEPAQSKYPDHFCIGYNGQSTIDVTIGPSLPLNSKETRNHYFYEAQVEYREDSIEPYINIFVAACDDQNMVDEVRSDFRDWISAQGYNPDLYTIEIPYSCPYTLDQN